MKRRYRMIDTRISSLVEWTMDANRINTQRLDKLNNLIEQAATKTSDATVSAPKDVVEIKLIALLTELSQSASLPPYYILLLEHLQQLQKNTGKSHQPSEPLLRPVNGGFAG